MLFLKRKKASRRDHDDVDSRLAQKERELREYERRVQVLRLETGLYGLRRERGR